MTEDFSRYFYAITLRHLQILSLLTPTEQLVLLYFSERARNKNKRGVALSIKRYAMDCWHDLLSEKAFSHAVASLVSRHFLHVTDGLGHDLPSSRRRFYVPHESLGFLEFQLGKPFLRYSAAERLWLIHKLMGQPRRRLKGVTLLVYWYLALRSRHTQLNRRGVFASEAVRDLTLSLDDGTQFRMTINAFKLAVAKLVKAGLIAEKRTQRDGRIRYVTATPTGEFMNWQDKKSSLCIENDRFTGIFGTDGCPLPPSQQPENKMYAWSKPGKSRTKKLPSVRAKPAESIGSADDGLNFQE